MRIISGLNDISDTVRLLICDLWGVMHNGVTAHVEAIDAIERARSQGIISVFLSNAPRPRDHVRSSLIDMGVPQSVTNNIVTSGGLARDAVRKNYSGAVLYHLGPDSDHNTIDGLPVDLCDTPKDADIILATGLVFRDVQQHRNLLSSAIKRDVPFLCANPDRIVHVGDKLYTCAGAVADLYEDMGGRVEWYGKPMASALHACLSECGLAENAVNHENILMVGDSLQTDIAGAHSAGYKSLFIAGGIHRKDWPSVTKKASDSVISSNAFQSIFGSEKPIPNYVSETFNW